VARLQFPAAVDADVDVVDDDDDCDVDAEVRQTSSSPTGTQFSRVITTPPLLPSLASVIVAPILAESNNAPCYF
jgi:hypothetical protein